MQLTPNVPPTGLAVPRPVPAGADRPPYALVNGLDKGTLEGESLRDYTTLAEGDGKQWILGERSWVLEGATGRNDAVTAARGLLQTDPSLLAVGWAPIPTAAIQDGARSLHLFEVLSGSGASIVNALHDGTAAVARPESTLDVHWKGDKALLRPVEAEPVSGYISRDADYVIDAATPRALRHDSLTMGGD